MKRALILIVLLLMSMPTFAQVNIVTPTPEPSDTTFEPAPQYATELTFLMVAVPRANVRTAPNLITGRVTTIAKLGERYNIVEQRDSEADGTWFLIEIGGDTGWIFGDIVLLANPDGIIEGDDTEASLARTNELAEYINSTVGVRAALRIRRAPSLDSEIIAIIPYGDRAYPIGRNSLNSWILVDYGGVLGWASVFGVVPPPTINLFALPVVR